MYKTFSFEDLKDSRFSVMETFCKMYLNNNKSISENCINLTLCTDYTQAFESITLTLIKNCLRATFKPKLET